LREDRSGGGYDFRVDENTLQALEYSRIRELLAQHAQTGLGRELALRIGPSRRASQVAHWLEQVEQFGRCVAAAGYPPFGGIRDVREHVRRAVPPAKLEPEEFGELASTLVGIGAVREYFAALPEDAPDIAKLRERLGDFAVVAERIGRVIDGRGRVRDEASERLERIRRRIAEIVEETRGVFDRLLKQPDVLKYLQYANTTFHADRVVLPLKAEQRGRVPGIIHRSSDSGHTLFVEPAAAVELNNRRIALLQDESEEINRLLWELTHLVHLNRDELLRTLEALAVIDLLVAKDKLAKRMGLSVPKVSAEGKLSLRAARNPVLMAIRAASGSASESVVPIDVRLGEDFDVLVVTGPNTGGKTAALKTVGLLAVMAQSGLPIPAEAGATLPVFGGVWIDVGDEQSLEQSLSTFSAHLARILDVLKRARRGTLVLLDELGAGTDPDEGSAIGRAIVEHLLAAGCLAMVTTHLGALKALAFEHQRVDNAAVQFDLQTLRPTYELRIGEPGNSHAIVIAERLGLPKRLIQAARQHLRGGHEALRKAIAGTFRARREAERARRDAEQARQESARATLRAMDESAALRAQQARYESRVERLMKLAPGDAVSVRSLGQSGRVVRVRFERQTATVALGSFEAETRFDDLVFPEETGVESGR
jgi:DNA mismatch repair protein MutS2